MVSVEEDVHWDNEQEYFRGLRRKDKGQGNLS